MKQIIKDVLNDMSEGQINLSSEAARETIASLVSAALKTKGEYKKHSNDELEEQEARKYWVCKICGQSSYDLDWDYIGSGTNHLSCEVRLELDEEKRKKDWYEDAGDGHLLKVDDLDKMKMKLSEDIVDSKDEGYIYESPDGGETIFKRKVGGSKRELVKNWEKISR